MNKHKSKQSFGFSLLELLAVVTILGIIAAVIIPRITNGTYKAKEKSCYYNVAQLNAAAERWYLEKGTWPAFDAYSTMGADLDYFPEGMPTCPVSGHKYYFHGTTHRVMDHGSTGVKGGGHGN